MAIVAFCDGSAIGNGTAGAKAGYGVVFPDHPGQEVSLALPRGPNGEPATNNRAETMALIAAFERADAIDPGRSQTLVVHSDSMLLVQSVTKWMRGWKARGWRKADGSPVLNQDLLQRVDACMQQRGLEMRHVRAHTGGDDYASRWNDVADRLARQAAAGGAGPVGG